MQSRKVQQLLKGGVLEDARISGNIEDFWLNKRTSQLQRVKLLTNVVVAVRNDLNGDLDARDTHRSDLRLPQQTGVRAPQLSWSEKVIPQSRGVGRTVTVPESLRTQRRDTTGCRETLKLLDLGVLDMVQAKLLGGAIQLKSDRINMATCTRVVEMIYDAKLVTITFGQFLQCDQCPHLLQSVVRTTGKRPKGTGPCAHMVAVMWGFFSVREDDARLANLIWTPAEMHSLLQGEHLHSLPAMWCITLAACGCS